MRLPYRRVCHQGRGLPLLEALSHRWGYVRANGANIVWFELLLVTVPAGWAAEPV